MGMDDTRKALLKLSVRLLIALPFIVIGFIGAFLKGGGGFGDAPRLVICMMSMLFGCIIIAPSIAKFLANPVSRIFYPEGKPMEAKPIYSAARSRALAGDYDGAIDEYRRVSEEFPDELHPHLEIIGILVVNLEDAARGAKHLNRALPNLSPQDRAKLSLTYESALAELDGKHDEVKQKINVDSILDDEDSRFT